MLSGTLPTGTVSSERDATSANRLPRTTSTVADGRGEAPASTERVATLEAENRALREELARREARREDLVDRYERLLARRERELAAARASPSDADPASLRDRIRGLVVNALQRL